ncbi:MAG: RNA 3'-terminal phosphate cyclase [Desulfurococcaceae archaeon]
MNILEIDGSIGEGGGQILRYALALSSMILRPVRIFNIRAKRDNPGLRPQHLTAVNVLKELTDAEVEGARVGSTELVFKPCKYKCGDFEVNIGTAGSVSLVIQAILPVLLFGKCRSRIILKGGTNVQWSPPIDYMIHVFSYNIKHFGIDADIKLIRRGHYPRGGGIVELAVSPVKEPLRSINIIKRGKLQGIHIISHCVKLPRHVAERQAEAALNILKNMPIKPSVIIEAYPADKDPHLGPGSGILIYAEAEPDIRLGGDSIGEKGKPAEKVGEEAAISLIEDLETGMAFDRHMGDMLIPYMFLAKGRSVIGVSRVTSHLLTAIEISKMFMPNSEVKVEGELNKPGLVKITGIGFYA